jgi:hypothetical protein
MAQSYEPETYLEIVKNLSASSRRTEAFEKDYEKEADVRWKKADGRCISQE